MKKVIEVKNLEFSYSGEKVLKNISFDVVKGEIVGIIGNTGAGKTTLLLNLNGILNGSGKIKIMGIEVKSKNLKEIRKHIGIVFQRPDDQLFCPTVFDDIAFGPINMGYTEEEVKKRVEETLNSLSMNGFETRSPHHLSEGEKKKVSIATVIAMSPAIIAFDEPTANLDPKSRKQVINLIKDIDATKLIASHDVDMIFNLCSRIILLNEGKIEFDGKTSELKERRDILKKNDFI